jgi:hypothetical protein
MITSAGIELAAMRIKRLCVLRDFKFQPLQTQQATDKQGSFGREVSILQGSFLILCLVTIIGLSLLPNVFVLAKVEKDVASENDTTIYNKGLTFYNLGIALIGLLIKSGFLIRSKILLRRLELF